MVGMLLRVFWEFSEDKRGVVTSFFAIKGPSRKTQKKKFPGVQEVPRKGKIASIYVWIMLSALIKLVIDKKLFPKWGLIFYNESSVTGLGRSIGIILRLDSEYLLCENICFHIWQSWNFS